MAECSEGGARRRGRQVQKVTKSFEGALMTLAAAAAGAKRRKKRQQQQLSSRQTPNIHRVGSKLTIKVQYLEYI